MLSLQKTALLLKEINLFYDSTIDFTQETGVLENSAIYFGVDPTAPFIHLGHIANLIAAQKLSENGFKVIILLGDFTATVGDPSLRVQQRKALSHVIASVNAAGIIDTITTLASSLKIKFELLHNSEWLSRLQLATYLEIASKFNVRDILKARMFEERLKSNEPLYLNEFMYCTLQAYDFWHLYKTKQCVLQIGGQDQWNNMLCGQQLINTYGHEAYIMTIPLLTNADGIKLGKTQAGTLKINITQYTVYNLWVSLYNLDDHIAKQIATWMQLLQDSILQTKTVVARRLCTMLYPMHSTQLSIIESIGRCIAYRKDIDLQILQKLHNLEILTTIKFKDIVHRCKQSTSREIDHAVKTQQVRINNRFITSINELYIALAAHKNNIIAIGKYFYIFTYKAQLVP